MDELQRIIKARSNLVTDSPFFGTLALHLDIVPDSSIDTAATDGASLFVNLAYTSSLTAPELRGLLAHEVWHCAQDHIGRLGNRDLKLWNVSTDLTINHDLLDSGFELPKGALVDRRFMGMSAESIYAEKHREAESKRQQQQRQQQGQQQPGNGQQGQQQPGGNGQQQPGQGQQQGSSGQQGTGQPQAGQQGQQPGGTASGPAGAGKPGNGQPGTSGQPSGGKFAGSDPGMCGGIIPAQPGKGAELAQEWKARAIAAAAVAARAGSLPGFVARQLDSMRASRIDWRAELRRIVTDSMSRDYSWAKPNRRFIHAGLYLPAMVSDGRNRVLVAIDTSGSIDDSALAAFLGELQALLDDGTTDSVTVLDCDTRINQTAEYQAGDLLRFEPKGGGGTKFAPVMTWAAEHGQDSACLIYFTDLDCRAEHMGSDPGLPVIWANWSRPRPAPFGEVLQIDGHA